MKVVKIISTYTHLQLTNILKLSALKKNYLFSLARKSISTVLDST